MRHTATSLAIALALLACRTPTPARMPAPTAALHDIWALETLAGQPYTPAEGVEHPSLELNLTDMRALGTDGCNRFTGDIREADAKTLAFGPLAGTRRLCHEGMATADAFTRALAQTVAYRREGLTLTFLDGDGAPIMVLRKVD